MRSIQIYLKKNYFVFLTVLLFFSALGGEDKTDDKKKEKKPPKIIEEIVVTAKTPEQQPISTVSKIDKKKLVNITPRDLGDVMGYVSGIYVSEGQKNESNIQIRGLSSNRLTLLYDGIPIYEPYFNSFDLNTLTTSGIEAVKVIKGANSVLYGPNTMGGVINVVSMRPTYPSLFLNTQVSGESTFLLSGSGSYSWDQFDMFVSINLDQSDGYYWNNDGERTMRRGSDYKKQNYIGKFYYYPAEKIEIMAQILFYTAEYGIPAATEYLKSRYWRFDDWDRYQFSLGATVPLGTKGSLKARAYYVKHYNVLDAYESEDYTELQWASTYDNHSFGAFVLGDYSLSEKNTLKFSINAKNDQVKIQDDIDLEWEEFQHETYSVGLEDHISISGKWKLIGGASLDYLKKQDGENKTRLNPIIGIKFAPREWIDFHLSLSQKSRFPSMKSLYSTSSGNPDLIDETGRNIELGFTIDRDFFLNGAVFFNRIEDMIQSYRGLEGFKYYENVGKAEIYGLEFEANKRIGIFYFNVGYTYLEARDMDQDQPLDYVPRSQFNLMLQIGDFKGFSLFLWGLSASSSQAKLGKKPPFDIVNIPGYTLVNASIEKKLGPVVLFFKIENILDESYFTEPGFPMKARTVSFGFKTLLEDK
ncbi:MAG: TonB-dependent receptor [Candidatus Aminicenantes bacterium]|nr:TonB-dependent receptor [Candidatus Aminicenantes bacterium]